MILGSLFSGLVNDVITWTTIEALSESEIDVPNQPSFVSN